MANQDFQESPTKDVIILVVTVTGRGPYSRYIPCLKQNSSFKGMGIFDLVPKTNRLMEDFV